MNAKRFWVVVSLMLGGAGSLFAAPPVYEQVIGSAGTGTTVSVSTSAWTLIPAASSLAGRTGMFITNDESNSANCALLISASTPSEAITVKPAQARPGVTVILGVGNNLNVYARCLTSSAANVHIQELRQF